MSVTQVLKVVSDGGIRLRIRKGRLQVRDPECGMTSDLRRALLGCSEELVAALDAERKKRKKPSAPPRWSMIRSRLSGVSRNGVVSASAPRYSSSISRCAWTSSTTKGFRSS